VIEAHGVEFLEIAGRYGLIFPLSLPDPGAACIRAARDVLMLSRDDFATLAGIGVRALAKIESGSPDSVVDNITACLRVIKKSRVDLFELDGRQIIMLPPARQHVRLQNTDAPK
jgi:predicted transcriptional regulator